ncbi:hypothetical protein UA08_07633 [Talaromyces atroroseus]|uniref:Core domain-containing protein n=1 Tax=Talaromyces atroroseus TaxID=1441469 RepID=A0A225ANH2_TALAT|nr:hypothetical protein UA08_07633 [Talaromyces atroroseus]OKL57149.1 hypothetical protein UA08_07633 [Talaromyces atroroseus]
MRILPKAVWTVRDHITSTTNGSCKSFNGVVSLRHGQLISLTCRAARHRPSSAVVRQADQPPRRMLSSTTISRPQSATYYDSRRHISNHPSRSALLSARRHPARSLLLPSFITNNNSNSAAFSTTTTNRSAVATLNPRVDDDGNPMYIEISPRAAKRLSEITASSEDGQHLRVTVTSGGCHGFQYMMSLEPSSKLDEAEDTVFEATDTNEQSPHGQARVVMDQPSLELLSGSTVDYTTELIGSQFKQRTGGYAHPYRWSGISAQLSSASDSYTHSYTALPRRSPSCRINGQLSREFTLGRIDEKIREGIAISPEEEPVLSRVLQSLCNDDGLISEAAFLALLQTNTDLPRSPEGTRAGKIVYASLAYLSTLPYPSSNRDSASQPGLSQAQITRALVWALPSTHSSFIEESNFSRMRTRADHRRLIFQSLASTTCHSQPYDPESARQLALRNALDTDWEGHLDLCATNHDDDGDEIYHDLLDVLYSTQIVKHAGLAPVPRDAFRPIAKRIAADNELASLYSLGIPADDFVSLAKFLLAFQFDVSEGVDLNQFDAAAKSLCATFCQQNEGEVITWPMFDHSLKTIAPYLFDPLYHMITLAFLDKEGFFLTGCESGNTIEGSILTVPLMSQLSTFLAGCAYIPDFCRCQHYSKKVRPTPTAFVRALEDVPDEAFMFLSGKSSTTGETFVFGVFSPKPKLDGASIQTSIVPGQVGLEPCSIFQLAPIQDVFRGVTGKPGWIVGNNDDTVIFGQIGGDGVVMALKDGLRCVEITHRVSEGDDTTQVYRPNAYRGTWEVSFEISEMEIWSELDQ